MRGVGVFSTDQRQLCATAKGRAERAFQEVTNDRMKRHHHLTLPKELKPVAHSTEHSTRPLGIRKTKATLSNLVWYHESELYDNQ